MRPRFCLADAFELGAPRRFHLWLGHPAALSCPSGQKARLGLQPLADDTGALLAIVPADGGNREADRRRCAQPHERRPIATPAKPIRSITGSTPSMGRPNSAGTNSWCRKRNFEPTERNGSWSSWLTRRPASPRAAVKNCGSVSFRYPRGASPSAGRCCAEGGAGRAVAGPRAQRTRLKLDGMGRNR